MPQYCHNPPLGTIPNAKIRIRTPYAGSTVRFGSNNRPQRCRNAPAPRSAYFGVGFFAYFGPRLDSGSNLRQEETHFRGVQAHSLCTIP